MQQTVVFRQGENGVAIMRIPGLAVSKQGTLLAFCEARDAGDRSPTDLVLKRSEDGGVTWGPVRLLLPVRPAGRHDRTALRGRSRAPLRPNRLRPFHATQRRGL